MNRSSAEGCAGIKLAEDCWQDAMLDHCIDENPVEFKG
jgi:hypothetical protein